MAEDSFETDGVRYFVTKGFISVPYMCPVLYPATRVITVPEMTWLSWAGWHRRQEGARGSGAGVAHFGFLLFPFSPFVVPSTHSAAIPFSRQRGQGREEGR